MSTLSDIEVKLTGNFKRLGNHLGINLNLDSDFCFIDFCFIYFID